MRLSSTSLLLAGVIVAGAAMFNCSAPDAADDGTTDVAAVTAIGNPIGLRLIYDERSSTVRALLHQKLEPDERLRLQVRRGRLSAQSPYELDCTKLPEAPVLSPSMVDTALGAVAGAASVTEFQGPIVDPSLLATVYDEQWILDHVTPKMLEELQTQGADSIVEACVMSGPIIHTRVQTQIAEVWDQADPLLAYGHTSTEMIDTMLRPTSK